MSYTKKTKCSRNRIKRIKKQKNLDHKTYFDKLYIRIFLSSFLLLLMIFFQNIFHFNISKLINQNINVFPLINLFTNIYNINDLPVNVENHYDNIVSKNNINYFYSNSFNGVIAIKDGIVVKIKKEDDLYFVTIKSENNKEYTYGDLSNIDVYLYSYIKEGTIIGGVNNINNQYCFKLTIQKDQKFYYINED